MKTNSKEVRTAIKKHILECVYSENEEYYNDIKYVLESMNNFILK